MVELNRPRRLEVDYVLETRDGDWVGVEVKLGPMALADCFAVALAASVGAELLTGDPEIVDRAEFLPCGVVDLR